MICHSAEREALTLDENRKAIFDLRTFTIDERVCEDRDVVVRRARNAPLYLFTCTPQAATSLTTARRVPQKTFTLLQSK